MQRFILFLFFMLLAINPIMLVAQNDTSTLQYTIADTAIARNLLNEAIELINQSKFDDAYTKADKAREIWQQVRKFTVNNSLNVFVFTVNLQLAQGYPLRTPARQEASRHCISYS